MAKLTYGSGAVSVTLDNGFEELIRLALDKTIPGIVAKMEQVADSLEENARSKWPVRTGKSRDGLRSEVRVAPGFTSVRARLVNDVPYARFIKSPRVRTGTGSAYVELMRRPTEAAAVALAEELKPIIESTLSGRG